MKKNRFGCSILFESMLQQFGRGLGRGFEASWTLFVPHIFGFLSLRCSPEGLWEPPGRNLNLIFRGLGGVWEGFLNSKLIFWGDYFDFWSG